MPLVIPFELSGRHLVLDSLGSLLLIFDADNGELITLEPDPHGAVLPLVVTNGLGVVRVLKGTDRAEMSVEVFPLAMPGEREGILSVASSSIAWNGTAQAWQAMPRVIAHPTESEILLVLDAVPGELAPVTLPGPFDRHGREWGLFIAPMNKTKSVAVARYRTSLSISIIGLEGLTQIGSIDIPRPMNWLPNPPVGEDALWIACGPLVLALNTRSRSIQAEVDIGSRRDDAIVDVALNTLGTLVAAGLLRSGAVAILDASSLRELNWLETADTIGAVALLEDSRLLVRAFDEARYWVLDTGLGA